MKVIVDCHGADLGVPAAVEGALLALSGSPTLEVVLCGRREEIKACLDGKNYDSARLSIADAGEPVTNDDTPTVAVRRKKDSSMVRALTMLGEGGGDAVVSAGNTGALLVGVNILVKCVKGVKRATMASVVTSLKGTPTLIADMGANVDCKPEMLFAFAVMGSEYMRRALDVDSPKVALLSNGREKEKGNALNHAAYELLEKGTFDFIGNVEPTDLMTGEADVIVTDGFAGNMTIKAYEGMGKAMMSVIKEGIMSGGIKSKLGYLLLKDVLRQVKKKLSADEVGGAVFLGARGVVVKTHGASTAESYRKSVLNAEELAKRNIPKAMEEGMAKYEYSND